MDLRRLLARKRQRLDAVEAEAAQLREEVTTLERALAIWMAEEGDGASGSSPAPVETVKHDKPVVGSVIATARFAGLDAELDQPKRTLVEAIRDIVRELPEPFSTGMVRNRIKEEEPDLFAATHYSSISGTMRRMAVAGELEPETKGGPGKEATYKRGRGAANDQPSMFTPDSEGSTESP